MGMQTIAVVDLNDYRSGDEKARAQFVSTVGDALCDIGFFALAGHGIPSSLIADAYQAAEEFFILPDEAKERYELAEMKGQRGFTSFGREHAKDHDAPDLKEFWHVGRETYAGVLAPGAYLHNLWPDEVARFREVFVGLFDSLDRCALEVLAACGEYLGIGGERLRETAVDGNSILRLLHYPPVPPDANPSSLRAAPHEDINLITLLCEATEAGLELQRRDGEWVPVQALPGQIVIDAGDMLQHLTNGVLRSTTHRVVNPDRSGARRLSMPFFVHPRSEVDLTPLPECVEQCGGEVRFEPITAGAFLEKRLREIGLS